MAETASSGGDARYKIGDVCRIADVQPYVLRYWESEFPLLAPDKSVPGPRTYSARELKLIEQIKRLLYDEGYTIAGAKKRLEAEGGGKTSAADTNPIVAPLPETTAEKAEKAEKPAKSDRAEKVEKAARAARPAKPPAPKVAEEIEYELPAPEITVPVPEAPQAAAAAGTAAPAADARIERALADLRDVLALLSRPLP